MMRTSSRHHFISQKRQTCFSVERIRCHCPPSGFSLRVSKGEKSNNSLKLFRFTNIEVIFLFVFIYYQFYFIIICDDSAVFTHGDILVSGCGSEWQTFHNDIRLFTVHFTKRRLAVHRYWLPWIIWASVLLCLFINQTLLQPMRKLCP